MVEYWWVQGRNHQLCDSQSQPCYARGLRLGFGQLGLILLAFHITKKPRLSCYVGPRSNRFLGHRDHRQGCVSLNQNTQYMLCHLLCSFLCKGETYAQVHMTDKFNHFYQLVEVLNGIKKKKREQGLIGVALVMQGKKPLAPTILSVVHVIESLDDLGKNFWI